MNTCLNISHYIQDGFKKVCDVANGSILAELNERYLGKFYYTNTDESLLFSKHNSWVYMIVDDTEVVKIGETGQPLGIRGNFNNGQPVWSTACRLGRLASWDDNTDGRIRKELDESTKKIKVSIWAKPCQKTVTGVTVGGVTKDINLCFHKDLELAYLDYFYENVGRYPKLNVGRK